MADVSNPDISDHEEIMEQSDGSTTEACHFTESEKDVFKTPEVEFSLKASCEKSNEETVDSSKFYEQPSWTQICPSSSGYFFEVIKNGIPLAGDTIDLSDIDHCILGRQPGPLLNPKCSTGRSSALLHPSISRAHAVLQFGSNSNLPPGWYIYDLDSTHGTFVNKRRVPPSRYIRLRVGYVLRLGFSTRLLVLHGPESDVESETKETWSELVAKKKARLARIERAEEEPSKGDNEVECNWGISYDVEDDGSLLQQRLAESGNCLSHEKSYIEDPKKALKAYFDREGIDPPPEYEFVEGQFGQQMCRIELPLEVGTVFAEVPVTGRKRKEAVVACALEACRMLDRLGEFDPNREGGEAVRRLREKAHLQSNDFYSSDEDTFLDRTGQVEARRRRRMRRLGVEEAGAAQVKDSPESEEEASDSLSVLATLEKLGLEIVQTEERIDAAEKAMEAIGENVSELDELEAYMNAIKMGAPKRAERQALKRHLVALRREEMRLLRKLGIRGGVRSSAAAAIRSAAKLSNSENGSSETVRVESKLNSIKRQLIISGLENRHPIGERKNLHEKEDNEEFIPEVDEDEDIEVEKGNEKTAPEEISVPAKECKNDQPAQAPQTLPSQALPNLEGEVLKRPHSLTSDSAESELAKPKLMKKVEEDSPAVSAMPEVHPPKSPQNLHKIPEITDETTSKGRLVDPLPQTDSSLDQIASGDGYDSYVNDPDFALWLPPQDQTGDGITELNKKYGY